MVAAIVHEYGEELCGVIVTDDIVRNYGGFVGLALDLVLVMAMALALALVGLRANYKKKCIHKTRFVTGPLKFDLIHSVAKASSRGLSHSQPQPQP